MLSWSLADLRGNEIASLDDRAPGASVTRTIGEHRRASVTIPAGGDAASQLAAQPYRGTLSSVLRVALGDRPVFAGVVIPAWRSAGVVELSALGASWRLEHAFLHADTGDLTADQGDMIFALIDLARPDSAALAAGVLDLPIRYGAAPATRQRTKQWNAGTAAWSAIGELTALFDGPELDFRPVHEEGEPVYCELEIGARLGADLRDEIIFADGTLDQNATVDLEPGGEQTINFATALGPTAEEGFGAPRQESDWLQGEREIGRYETWIGAGESSEPAILKALARQQVMAYGEPPPFLTIAPAMQEGSGYATAPALFADYDVGDTVTAVSRRWAFGIDEAVRVRSGTLTEVDSAGNLRATIECVPEVFRAGVG